MALTISLSAEVSADRTEFVVTDGTVYGTGGNPARSAVGVFAKGYKVSHGNVATTLTTTSDDSDPETDSVWTIEYTVDGFYRVYFVIVPDYSAGTYAQYAAVFQPSDNKVFRSKQANNTESDLTNTTWWEEITDPATLAANKDTASESLNITSQSYVRVFSANSQYTYGNQLSSQDPHTEDDEDASLRKYNIFAKMLDEVAIADSRSEVMDGELICRRMESHFNVTAAED